GAGSPPSRVDSLNGVAGKLSAAFRRPLLDLLDARAAGMRGTVTPRSAVPTFCAAGLLPEDPLEPFEHRRHARYLPPAREWPQSAALCPRVLRAARERAPVSHRRRLRGRDLEDRPLGW